MASKAAGKAGKDRTLEDLDLEDDLNLGPDPEAPAPAVDAAVELSNAPLAGAGMAGIDRRRIRYGHAGAGFVAGAAGAAEDARGGEGGDLIVLSIPEGELGRVMGVLEELGVRPPVNG